ncbi:smoothened homolog [Anneissia japonica]|uniref:smoothened homolog n=1 Tax=Anneissia japonica TaxID=1529436 RepID=UPI001425B7B9|nr:smoothened homolog [Anneissia japonica]
MGLSPKILLNFLIIFQALHFTQALNISLFSEGHCTKTVPECVPVEITECLGNSIGFSHTSLSLANDSTSQEETQNRLAQWKAIQSVPRCWEVIQPFLCSVYLPKCVNGTVELPSMDMCTVTRSPCKVVETARGWPEFLKCKPENFPEGCENSYKELTFNTSGKCEPPLVATENEKSWYDGVDGCGIQCQNPLYSQTEHERMHTFIAVFASICAICTFFTLLTFFADWKNSSKYPALILFYMNGCFFVGSIGWLAQFSNGARDDIVCRKDGTMRQSEPSEGENLSCVIIFIIVYYFLMAGVIWFVMLAFAWHISFKALGTPKDAMNGKTSYFHLFTWSIPFLLVVVIMAFNQIDGDSVSGICFVGYKNLNYRAIFLLAPIGIALVIGAFFLINGLMTLCGLQRGGHSLLNEKASARISRTIARIGVFAVLAFSFIFISFACHLYEFTNQEAWEKGFRDYMVCEANVSSLRLREETEHIPLCSMNSKPNLTVVMLHIFSLFGAGIAMSMWVWTPATLSIWHRAWRKITRQPINEPQKLKKCRMIAKAFAKKDRLKDDHDDADGMSVSFESASHDDPLGMRLEIPPSSVTDETSSANWGNNVPTRMLTRRGAAVPVPLISAISQSSSSGFDPSVYRRPYTGRRNLVQAEVTVEPPPTSQRVPSRLQRKKRLAPVYHRPTGLETPIADQQRSLHGSGINRNGMCALDDPLGLFSHKPSSVPKLPAIPKQKRVMIVQQPFEMECEDINHKDWF